MVYQSMRTNLQLHSYNKSNSYINAYSKLRTDYSQEPEGMLVGGMVLYEDRQYELTSIREYVGPYVFTGGKLEYSAFAGGYFDADKGQLTREELQALLK